MLRARSPQRAASDHRAVPTRAETTDRRSPSRNSFLPYGPRLSDSQHVLWIETFTINLRISSSVCPLRADTRSPIPTHQTLRLSWGFLSLPCCRQMSATEILGLVSAAVAAGAINAVAGG